MKTLPFTQAKKDDIGLSYVLAQVDVTSPLSKRALYACHYFAANDKQKRIQYFQNMKRLKDVMTSDKEAWNAVKYALRDLIDIVPILDKVAGQVELDATDLYLLKKHVALEKRVMQQEALCKASGLLFTDHVRVETLLRGNRPLANGGPVRLALSDFDDQELAKARAEQAALNLQLPDASTRSLPLLLKTIEAAERRVRSLEAKTIEWLRQGLLPFCQTLTDNLNRLVDLDVCMGKIQLADLEAEMPRLDQRVLAFTDAYHLEEKERLSADGRTFTTQDVSVTKGVTLITGANMSGKSVALNTVFLNALLVNLGFYPFAKTAKVPLFDSYHHVGDVAADRRQGLSTFGTEVVSLKKAVQAAETATALLVIDEPFRGTNPEEGRSLASGLVSYLQTQESFTLMATHYRLRKQVKLRHYMSGDMILPEGAPLAEGAAIAQLAAHIDYRLKDVSNAQEVPQRAIDIAGWLGLQPEIIEQAKRTSEEVMG